MSDQIKYDTTYGGPFDRGSADSWYRRPRSPHYYKGATYASQRIPVEQMTPQEIKAYHAGYDSNEATGGHKEWE